MAAFPEFYCEDIPALAGNTGRVPPARWRAWDHPRSHGEYASPVRAVVAGPGSSPLSRGIRRVVRFSGMAARIIPALAGNTSSITESSAVPRDHPRSRGEYVTSSNAWTGPEGSSPLSRGIRNRESRQRVEERIIPALAGNTTPGSRYLAVRPDHPRSRGEYDTTAIHQGEPEGSSPLSRGIR